MLATRLENRTELNASKGDDSKASIEHAAMLLRQSVSEAELAGKIDERKALAFIEQIREIERVLTNHR